MAVPEATNLGPFPILQLAFAVLVLVGLALAAWKGLRDKGTGQNVDVADEQRVFLDGPLKHHLEQQNDILENSRALVNVADRMEREKLGEEMRKHTDLLQRIIGLMERFDRHR